MAQQSQRSGRSAALVAAGILVSRLAGLVRQKLFAHVLGSGLEAAAFSAATRIPNVLQNLLGEGVLSASFIPVYAGLRAKGDEAQAKRMAGAIFGLLASLVCALVGAGVLAAPLLVTVIAPGYDEPTTALTISLVRVIFPGTGVLVLSAWCLGILNSHRRFFLSYAAPVVWNGAIIAALVATRNEPSSQVITIVAWATVVGSALQFFVQLPSAIRLLGGLDPRPSVSLPAVREVLAGFGPAVTARGVVQVSAYVDLLLASLVSARAVSVLTYSQTIALLPVSLFGMSVSAAELPELSADATKSAEERQRAISERLRSGLERIAFFVVPSAVAFIALGDVLCGVLLESGRFTAGDSRLGWYVLLGSGVACMAQPSGRLFSSTLYALKDTKTPLRFAIVRVVVGVTLGFAAVRGLGPQLGLPVDVTIVFLTMASSVTAWLETTLLRRALVRALGDVPRIGSRVVRLVSAALVSAAATLGVKFALLSSYGARPRALEEWGGDVLPFPNVPAIQVWRFDVSTLVTSIALLGVFGVVYFGVTGVLRIPQATALWRRVLRRR